VASTGACHVPDRGSIPRGGDFFVLFFFNLVAMIRVLGAIIRRRLFIQVEATPNEHALKFLPGRAVAPDTPREFLKVAEARGHSQLAASLLELKGVSSVFLGKDFIAVNKREGADWRHLRPQVLSAITECVIRKEPFFVEDDKPKESSMQDDAGKDGAEVVKKIRSILDDKIRPAVQGDGGDVEFKGFVNGWVRLRLQGACRSCASSAVTLRNGIENMLMYYVPEVKGVEEVQDDLDIASQAEYERLEETLAGDETPKKTEENP
jgi:NFU1 iron-sulfur cluster scaffold homolog, mitochondrial